MAGRFITLEGGEGVGKSTQAQMLVEALRVRGVEVLLTREPGGTPGAEAIRDLVLNGESDWNLQSEGLLFAAARADHVAHAIRPALANNIWVICDRFIDSSRAYQGGEGGLSDAEILQMHAIGSQGLLPDRTILLTAPEEQVAQRLAARDGTDSDRIGGRSLEYHRSVVARFCSFAENESERFAQVDAIGLPKEVHQRVLGALAPLLEPLG